MKPAEIKELLDHGPVYLAHDHRDGVSFAKLVAWRKDNHVRRESIYFTPQWIGVSAYAPHRLAALKEIAAFDAACPAGQVIAVAQELAQAAAPTAPSVTEIREMVKRAVDTCDAAYVARFAQMLGLLELPL